MMSITNKALAERAQTDGTAHVNTTGQSQRRKRVGTLLLVFAVLAALGAGGWGLFSSLASGAPPARIGEAVEVTDGLVRVDRVTPENMAPMQMGKFAAGGMNMSSTGMDMAPKGQRRFAVDVSLVASGGSLEYSAEDFKVRGESFKETGPIRHQLASGTIANGDAISRVLIFQVPESAKNLMLNFDGGRSVALDLPASKDSGHSQGGESQEGGHDH